MADSASGSTPGPYSRPPSSATQQQQQQPPLHSPSPRPSVASRGSRSSLRRQAAIAAGSASASASASASIQQQAQQQLSQQQLPQASQPTTTEATEPSPQPLRFTQLFTTITSTTHPSGRTSTHHPTVHYVFADDDPRVLTSALAQYEHGVESDDEQQERQEYEDEGQGRQGYGTTNRAVVLDIVPHTAAAAGYEVVWASSLSADWAVVEAHLGRMDGGGGGGIQGTGGGGGMLTLRIEGVSVEAGGGEGGRSGASSGRIGGSGAGMEGRGVGAGGAGGKDKGKDTAKEKSAKGQVSGEKARKGQSQELNPSEEYPALIDEFAKRMDVLRRVVEAAEVRRRVTEAAAAAEGEGEGQGEADEEEDDDEETQRPPDGQEEAGVTAEEENRGDKGKGKEVARSVQGEDDEAGPTTG
ncbi:hypothetical protein GE09DRAFT_1068950 [Coniochaeta sp. 2T2.1]|nr:hypothetical protein GE09DRAFT_1068950 [Coniochaeta sp. 2T2.1]